MGQLETLVYASQTNRRAIKEFCGLESELEALQKSGKLGMA